MVHIVYDRIKKQLAHMGFRFSVSLQCYFENAYTATIFCSEHFVYAASCI